MQSGKYAKPGEEGQALQQGVITGSRDPYLLKRMENEHPHLHCIVSHAGTQGMKRSLDFDVGGAKDSCAK